MDLTSGFGDLRLLEYFRVSGRLEHLTKAAEILGITQSALSRAMRRLEADLGVPLFERHGRSIRLTQYGLSFLERVERGLNEFEVGRSELLDMSSGERGTVSFGFLRTLAASYAPNLLSDFRSLHPGIRFNVREGRSAVLEAGLEQGDFDVVLSIVPPRDKSLNWKETDQRKLQLMVPLGHALANRTEIPLRDAAGEAFVVFRSGHAIRNVMDELCLNAGFRPRVAIEAEESTSVHGFVAAGFGVAVVPEGTPNAGAATIRLLDTLASRSIGFVWLGHRYLPQCAILFRDFAIQRDSSNATRIDAEAPRRPPV